MRAVRRTSIWLVVALFWNCPVSPQQGGETAPRTLKIDGSEYVVEGGRITQVASSFFQDGVLRVVVVSDIEGHLKNVRAVAEKIRPARPDFILVAGDSYENANIRARSLYSDRLDPVAEMERGLLPLAESGVPVFVIPGHMETRAVYGEAIARLNKNGFTNVVDIHRRSLDLKGVNVVGMGGYHVDRFLDGKGGFAIQQEWYEEARLSIADLLKQGEPVVFLTHGPPISIHTGIDFSAGSGHVGDNALAAIMNGFPDKGRRVINAHGHVHQGGGQSDDGYRAGTALNIGTVTSNMNKYAPNFEIIAITPDGKAAWKYF